MNKIISICFFISLSSFSQTATIPKINEFIGDVRSIITQKNNDLFTNFIVQHSSGGIEFISSKSVKCNNSQVAKNVKVASINYIKKEFTFLIQYLGCKSVPLYSEEITFTKERFSSVNIKSILSGNIDYLSEPITSYSLILKGNSQILRYSKIGTNESVFINGQAYLLSVKKTNFQTYQFYPFSTAFEGYTYRFQFREFDLSVKDKRFFKGTEQTSLLEFNKSYGKQIGSIKEVIFSKVLKDFQRKLPQTEIVKPVGNNQFLEDLQLIRRRAEQGTPDQIQLLRIQVLQLIQDYQDGKLQVIDNRSN